MKLDKDINLYTLRELREMEYMPIEGKAFTSVIIVPMTEVHDSGYRCMKYDYCSLGERKEDGKID